MTFSIPQASGIYIIKCSKNGKIYVGSAVNLKKRAARHWYDLRKNKHHSRHLQNAWNKYGEKQFEFKILERCEIEDLLTREQFWIDKLKPYQGKIGFNVSKTAVGLGVSPSQETRQKISVANTGKKRTPETRAKNGLAHLGMSHTPEAKERIAKGNRGRVRSSEERTKISIAKKGTKPSPQTLAAVITSKAKTYIVTSPLGEEMIITNLSKFCREQGLTIVRMSGLANGINNHHKGWKCKHG